MHLAFTQASNFLGINLILVEGYLWVAVVLGVGIRTEINVLTSNLSRLGSQLLGETTQVTLYTKGHLPPVSANKELLKSSNSK